MHPYKVQFLGDLGDLLLQVFHSKLSSNATSVECRFHVLSNEILLVVANPLLQTLPIERNFLSMPCVF